MNVYLVTRVLLYTTSNCGIYLVDGNNSKSKVHSLFSTPISSLMTELHIPNNYWIIEHVVTHRHEGVLSFLSSGGASVISAASSIRKLSSNWIFASRIQVTVVWFFSTMLYSQIYILYALIIQFNIYSCSYEVFHYCWERYEWYCKYFEVYM